MSKYTVLTDELHDYIVANGAREDPELKRIREETAALGDIAVMQIAPDQGAFLTMLTRLMGARRAIEIGTFTGYSAICIARGLDTDGILLCCELDPDRAEIAKANFERAGVAGRIEVRVGPAEETLDAIAGVERFDLAFIDADKVGYPRYFEQCLALLGAGGVIILDNVLMDGGILAAEPSEGAAAIDSLNRQLSEDERVDLVMVGIADGITIARKR